jgi:uncharacterized protein (DUF58 family)
MADPLLALHRAEELADTLPALLVAAERVAATVVQGVHGRRRVGQGEAFWQFRQYAPGDTISRIDWRQTAKSDRVFVRETDWEAAQSVWLWRDTSASMRYRSRNDVPEKAERADLLTLALAAMLMHAGEHVALMGENLPPSAGRSALNRLAQTISRDVAVEAGVPPETALPRYARVVLFGDFLSPLAEIDAAVRAIAARGVQGHLIQVLDPAEETLPFTGRTRFEGLEAEGDALIPRVESVRGEYHDVLAAHVQGLHDIARAVGWTLQSHRTDRSPHSALLSLYMVLSEPRGLSR